MWAVAVLLVGLIALSRLALHVHFPSDVLVGLLLGAVFAWLAVSGRFPQEGVARWLAPVLLLVLAAFLPAGTPREYGTALGLLAGFWFSQPKFVPPREWGGRVIVGLLGLVIVFAVYFALGALPQEVKDIGLVRALRYAVLVLVAVEGVPVVLRRWLPPAEANATRWPTFR